MMKWLFPTLILTGLLATAAVSFGEDKKARLLHVNPPHVSTDRSVKYDYDIVYVRAPRFGDQKPTQWTEVGHPRSMDPGADLMLLHPDGTEEVLVRGGEGSVTDPMVSFDGEWVYYAKLHDLTKPSAPWGGGSIAGSDIFKIHIKTRKLVQLTRQTYTPNTGAANWGTDFRKPHKPGENYLAYGVFNLGPCPLPGGRLMITSNRNGFRAPKFTGGFPALQLFVMDDDGSNVECIGHLNLSTALHPVILKDGRVMFSSFENQGLRSSDSWGLWSIRPDGTQWGPLVSAFDHSGIGANSSFHFQTQLSDGHIVVEHYYISNNHGFGTYFKFPPQPAEGYPAFGPADPSDERNPMLRMGRHGNGQPSGIRFPFTPHGMEPLTPFTHSFDSPAGLADLTKPDSPAVGKFTHPSGAPDNHLLTVWSPGPVNGQGGLKRPAVDGGIYLLKEGRPIEEPGQLLLIKNDPKYNEQWPRALVPYKRIYGSDEPKHLEPLANDGKRSPQLPEGTPFGLVGTSSLYKRESYPFGTVPKGSVTGTYRGGNDPYRGLDYFNHGENGTTFNWTHQGADAGKYRNDDIHAIRILAMEPTTDTVMTTPQGTFYSHARERLRILGEIPVRKFGELGAQPGRTGKPSHDQPLDPDGNPDTSFLARVPADTAWTFQTLDKNGMVLNMAQTWHQVRPGEVRHDCGGCHAHSQKPTAFKDTAAARPDYSVFDLTRQTPLLTTKKHDQSGKKWDAKDETGLRFEKGVKNVEFYRDVKPILDRSCVTCHTRTADKPAGNLVLDDDKPMVAQVNVLTVPSGTYFRLALDSGARFGHKPLVSGWRYTNASRYIRMFQSRRSLLVWKIFGQRLDGWTNDDFPTETLPGDPNTLRLKGEPVPNTASNRNRADLDFTGSAMPPPEAVQSGKAAPLTDEDRLTIVRWIDLGCPIDMDFDQAKPRERGYGWMCDDNRPTLTLAYPRAGANTELTRLLVGMHDYYSGLDMESFHVVADFAIDGVAAGENLAKKFRPLTDGVWELKLASAITELRRGRLNITVKDRQGNVSRVERTISVGR